MSIISNLTQITLLALFVVGCASEPKVNEFAASADPQVELERLEKNIGEVLANQGDVLTPTHYEAAQDAKNKALRLRRDNADQKDILHSLAVSQAHVDEANKYLKINQTVIPNQIAARQNALTANAKLLFPKEMRAIDSRLLKVSRKIEKNDLKNVEVDSRDIESDYQNLELKAITQTALETPAKAIEMAINEGAAQLTPNSLASARQTYAKSEASIAGDRRRASVVNQARANATVSANRLLKLTRRAKMAKEMTPEEYAREFETSAADVQAGADDLEASEQELAEAKQELRTLMAENEVLDRADSTEKVYETASQAFSPDEAEIFKQGNRLVVRLKNLSFENNRASLNNSNYGVLTKVNKIIDNIEPSQVIVQGHADSTGATKQNQALSLSRAQAVRSYLLANGDVAAEKVSAKGLGSAAPIATNKTAEGRAQNRRVEIIISTETKNR